jgi:glycosyltransferase involved in cell wall biosynthesis
MTASTELLARHAHDDAESTRTAVVGVSTRPICGVRDHAFLLAEELGAENVPCSLHWLSSRAQSLASTRAQMRAWTRALAAELDSAQPDAILLHYSVFAYSYRGMPLFVYPTVATLRRTGIPMITIMHEIAYPWRKGGLKGNVWAATHRAALVEVVRASAAVIVTADFRGEWLSSRPWLPTRPVALAPVFSNLPPPAGAPRRAGAMPVVGLFGYSFEPTTVALVLDAVRRLRDRGVQLRLALLGAPGESSPAGELWKRSAATREVAQALCFSGTLAAQELSDALAASDIVLYADPAGLASRKGTLAGALACGRPVIALEGRRRWSELVDAEAAHVVARNAAALADALQALLADERAREALGARGRAFAEQAMGVARTAAVVRGFLEEIAAQGPSRNT